MPSDYFCPAYPLSDRSRQAVHSWALAQDWPAGVELKDPDSYHVTCLYSPTGFADEANHRWLKAQPACSFTATCAAVESFEPGDGDELAAVVLRLEDPALQAHAESLRARAETELGLPISHFPGGYKAHITVAFASSGVRLPVPALAVDLGSLYEHHAKIQMRNDIDAVDRLLTADPRLARALLDAIDAIDA